MYSGVQAKFRFGLLHICTRLEESSDRYLVDVADFVCAKMDEWRRGNENGRNVLRQSLSTNTRYLYSCSVRFRAEYR